MNYYNQSGRVNRHYAGNCCEWCDDLAQGRAIGNVPPEGCADYMCGNTEYCPNSRPLQGGFTPGARPSQPYTVSMTASSPSIGPAAGTIGFEGGTIGEQDPNQSPTPPKEKYNLFTQQYFIGLVVGAAVGYLVLPKILKK